MTEPHQHIGQMIKEVRLSAGFSRKELGERLGITESAVAKLESRRNSPSISTLERIAKAAGVRLVVGFEK